MASIVVPAKRLGAALLVVLAACLAGMPATGGEDARAAVVRAYANGPVLYLSKGETLYAGKASIAASAAFLGALGGAGWAAGGAGAASIADTYIDHQVRRGYCLLVKMWYWQSRWTRVSFYRWWPCR